MSQVIDDLLPVSDEAPADDARRPFLGEEGRFRLGVAIACAPIIASVAWAIHAREWQAGDRSIMGVFTEDVFTRHTPLLGTISTMGNYSEHLEAGSVHHLGPAQFWALSIPNLVLRGHPAALLIGALLVNCGAVVLTATFVRRRLGTTAATGAVLMCTILAYGLGPTLLRDVWTPYLGLWPLLALVVLTWSLIDGDRWALPWTAFVSGFLAQIELMFVGPAAVLTIAGLVGFALRRRADRRAFQAQEQASTTDPEADAEGEGEGDADGDAAAPAAGGAGPPAPLGWTLITCQVIALVMWWPVIYDELTGDPGNLTLLIRAMGDTGDKAGFAFVRNNLIAQLQVPPVWVQRATSPFEVGQSPGVLAVLTAIAFAWVLAALTVSAWRRRGTEPSVFALLVTTYPVLLAAFVNLSITPEEGTVGLQYRRWLWPFGAFLWFAVIVGAVRWAAARPWSATARERWRPRTAELALLGVAAVAVIPASLGQLTPLSPDTRVNPMVQSMWSPLRERLPEKSTYLVVGGADAAFGAGPEIMRRLIVDGYAMRTSSFGADSYGEHRVLSADRPAEQSLVLVSGPITLAPPEPPERLLAVGTEDGSSADAYLDLVDELLPRVRGGPGFTFDEAGTAALRAQMDQPDGPGADRVPELLSEPTRAMFDPTVLRLQVAGHATSSPLSDDEALRLLRGMRHVGVLAFLGDAPETPTS